MSDVDNIKRLMEIDYNQPSTKDDNFQSKIYKKREYYYHKKQGRENMTDYKSMKEYRDKVCAEKFSLLEHQALLSNFINPDTPYKGLLVFHGTGTGKCLAASQRVLIDGEYIEIEKIWDRYAGGLQIKDDEVVDGVWAIPTKKIDVVCMVEDQKMGIKSVKHLYRQKIYEPINIVKLVNGSTVKITKRHKLLTESGWTNDLKNAESVAAFSEVPGETSFRLVKIESVIEEIYDGYVYDLEIDHYHNFVAEGVLVHNTCLGITIGEKFKHMVQKYGTKICVLVPGPLVKENWKNEIVKCAGSAYLRENLNTVINEQERARLKKDAINAAMQYYRFITYTSFYRKVLGEKIVEKIVKDDKVKTVYRKREDGEFERDVHIDRITNLDNSVIIVDEAHQLTGNSHGEALMKIIKSSKNLKVVLLTATPMKNLADDIIDLINFIRPTSDPIIRDKVFTSYKNHLMTIKPGGLDYLQEMTNGYVSYLRGADPLTFATRVDKGEIPPGLIFTKVTRCKMGDFQRRIYDEAAKFIDDSLDRKSQAVANFAFPALSNDQRSIVGKYGREGINDIKSQIKSYPQQLNKKISELLGIELDDNLMMISDSGKTLSGNFLKMRYLKQFSIKFYKSLKKLNRLVWGKKGAKLAFIYSNLVRVGIDMYREILLQNGYLEFNENMKDYKIDADTLCYFCGRTYKQHKQDDMRSLKREKNISESSSEYEKTNKEPPQHTFHPATFISIIGQSTEEKAEMIPENKKEVLDTYFNSPENREGKFIKFVLGSKVMSEAHSLFNIGEIHILDVHFNLGRVDQVLGRGIRWCGHYGLMNEQNKFPKVNVYKYVVSLPDGLSSEEELYKKAEQKYILIKKVERLLKENAIDCPLNHPVNIFPEEKEQYKDCVPIDNYTGKKGEQLCPSKCDFQKCELVCKDRALNDKYFKDGKYINVKKSDIDKTTFTNLLARNEIDTIKGRIKEMFVINNVYTLKDIVEQIKSHYEGEKRELLDEFFIFKALDELIPITENDFNNFKDTVYDKFNQPGYIIHRGKYYIFQPFNQNEDVPMHYRSTFNKNMFKELTLLNYIQNMPQFKSSKKEKIEEIDDEKEDGYDFDSVMEYYDSRPEFKYVGIIDKESNRGKIKKESDLKDVFKLRAERSKKMDKKRATGIPSLTGAVCTTSKSKEYLEDVVKTLNITMPKTKSREELCSRIKERMLFNEKYSRGKDKMTYVMIPKNHKTIPFPLNLEDRYNYIKKQIKDEIKFKIDVKVEEKAKKVDDKKIVTYEIRIDLTADVKEYIDFFKELGFKESKGKLVLNIE